MPSVTYSEGAVELVPLVGHLGQAQIHGAGGRRKRPAGHRDGFQRLLVGLDGRVQAAQSPLDLGELDAVPCGQSGLAGRLPPGGAGREGALGFREPATEPLGHGQESPGGRAQQPLALAALGQGPRGERRPGFGVAAELGEKATTDRDQRRDIHQHAAGPADGRLERLPGRARGRPLGRVQQRLHLLHPAAGDGQLCLGEQQPGAGPDEIIGQRR